MADFFVRLTGEILANEIIAEEDYIHVTNSPHALVCDYSHVWAWYLKKLQSRQLIVFHDYDMGQQPVNNNNDNANGKRINSSKKSSKCGSGGGDDEEVDGFVMVEGSEGQRLDELERGIEDAKKTARELTAKATKLNMVC